MEENTLTVDEGGEPVVLDTELSEFIGVDIDSFYDAVSIFEDSVTRIENVMSGQLVGLALIAGAIISLLIVRFFHVR